MKKRQLEVILMRLGYSQICGGKHDKWTNGMSSIAVPRHREISEGTASAIIKQARKGQRMKTLTEEGHE